MRNRMFGITAQRLDWRFLCYSACSSDCCSMQKIVRFTREPSISCASEWYLRFHRSTGGPIWRRHEALLYTLLPEPARKRSIGLLTFFLLLRSSPGLDRREKFYAMSFSKSA